ncbi:MAG: hypothetical protein ACI9JK_001789, partial [Phycisphaerales bacterium]
RGAFIIASRMPCVGRVTVSLLKSTVGVFILRL